MTWIFLVWALAASGAAIYFATQKPAAAKPAPTASPTNQSATAPDSNKSDKSDKSKDKPDKNDKSDKTEKKK